MHGCSIDQCNICAPPLCRLADFLRIKHWCAVQTLEVYSYNLKLVASKCASCLLGTQEFVPLSAAMLHVSPTEAGGPANVELPLPELPARPACLRHPDMALLLLVRGAHSILQQAEQLNHRFKFNFKFQLDTFCSLHGSRPASTTRI